MAVNGISAFWQTLVAEMTDAVQVLKPTWATLEQIYWDYKPEQAALAQTLNVPLPQDPSHTVTNIGNNDITLSDPNFNTVPIVFDQHPSFSYAVRSFEQFNSPTIIRKIFVDAAFTAVKNFINADFTSLFTTGNFTTNTAVSGSSSIVTTTNFTKALAILADQKVPVSDNVQDMTCLLPSTVYYALTDPASTDGKNWAQAFIAGNKFAEAVRETGTVPVAYGTQFRLDQQMPTSGAVGSRTFTAALMHRWAVAGVSRPLPEPDGKVVDFERYQFGPLEMRMFMSYNHYPKDAYIVTIDCGYGRKVVRENMCQLFSIAE
jgi:hypothetical protein